MHRPLATLAGLCLGLGAVSAPLGAGAITLTLDPVSGSQVESEASSESGFDSDRIYLGSLPFSDSHSVSNVYGSSAASYDFTASVFDATFAHTRTGNYGIADSFAVLDFSPNSTGGYVIEGDYSIVDPSGRNAMITIILDDFTTGTRILELTQSVTGVPNATLVVGAQAPQVGSLTGSLIAGHDYRLYYAFGIGFEPVSGSGPWSGSGSFRFSAVPEPGTAVLLAAGLAALGKRRRSRH